MSEADERQCYSCTGTRYCIIQTTDTRHRCILRSTRYGSPHVPSGTINSLMIVPVPNTRTSTKYRGYRDTYERSVLLINARRGTCYILRSTEYTRYQYLVDTVRHHPPAVIHEVPGIRYRCKIPRSCNKKKKILCTPAVPVHTFTFTL